MLKAYFWLRQLVVRQEGQGMTEYGLIIALVAVVLIGVLGNMGGGLQKTFEKIVTAITGQS